MSPTRRAKPPLPSGSPPPTAAALRTAFRPVAGAAKGLAGTAIATSYGTPSLKVKGKFFCRIREDGETLVVRMDLDSRELALRHRPKVYFITDHYRDYPAVLVRLNAVSPALLKSILADAWELVAPRSLRPTRKP